jgi:hypothetical protein
MKLNLLSKVSLVVLYSALLCNCAGTTFKGEAHINREACQKQCETWGMVLSGMVAMGEYSSGCVCKEKPKGEAAFSNDSSQDDALATATAAGAAVSAYIQTEHDRKKSNPAMHPVHMAPAPMHF